MKIFYSWQSDLENKHNRSFIKNALATAIKELNIDLGISEPDREIVLDHDTKGIPGTPDLAGTIFDKIASSTVFIADISFVAERAANSRKTANPNVLIELGYALSKLGSDRVIGVLNTASGSVEELPFDLKHKRHPIQFHIEDASTDHKIQKTDLIATLKTAIKSVIDFDQYKGHEVTLSANPSREEILNAVMSSDSKDDWERVTSNSNKETVFFKKNVNLRFKMEYTEAGTQCDDFKEPWANKHLDASAVGYWSQLYYCATHIDSYVLVSVDGGRALLPLPNSRNDLVVKRRFYKVAQIHDYLGSLDQYMVRSGLNLENIDLGGGFDDGSGFGGGSGSSAGRDDGSGGG